MSRPDPAENLLAALRAGERFTSSAAPRLLLLAAHPDDETISASALLGRVPDATVVFLTDGAPRDPQFRAPHVSGSREMYALVRAEEAACALAFVDLPPERIVFLNAADQEAIHDFTRVFEALLATLAEIRPDVIVTHPYEGGHPDHDTASLAAHLAAAELARQDKHTPALVEFTSYHASGGRRVSGEFLPAGGRDLKEVMIKLTPEERARKARMLGCYVSQWHVLSEFPLEPERLRIAPDYDFTQPPHQGPLWFECLHWPLTGARWREIAGRILVQQGAEACR